MPVLPNKSSIGSIQIQPKRNMVMHEYMIGFDDLRALRSPKPLIHRQKANMTLAFYLYYFSCVALIFTQQVATG